jgi:5-methylcytosine-specific restriction endonuclease McrA
MTSAARARVWREANKERAIATRRAWLEANKERDAATRRAYREANKERIAAARRAWWEANKERNAAAGRAWYAANREHNIADVHAHRAHKCGAVGHFTEHDIERLRVAQSGKCAAPRCDMLLVKSGTVNHIVPMSRGGSNWPDNIQLLCESCNHRKSKRTMQEWLSAEDDVTRGAVLDHVAGKWS